MIATVLLSYYATLGLTQWFFRAAYGSDWVGLDWKLPLFLFVILVAVGQDYNVYLVTRIVEEQRRLGWLSGFAPRDFANRWNHHRLWLGDGGDFFQHDSVGLVSAARSHVWFPVLAAGPRFEESSNLALRWAWAC